MLILKILGIIVLCILGLILLTLLLVLFAPIRYCSEGLKSTEETYIKGIITYLNPIVRVTVNYPDKETVMVKVLGITVFPTKTKKKQNNVQTKEKSKEAKEQRLPKSSETETKQKKDNSKNSTFDTIGYYVSLFRENKELVLDVLNTVLKAVKTVLPHKCKVCVVYGTGQADTTGYIYAIYCSLKETLPGEIYLEPVWTESHITGEYYLKGKVRIIHLLIAYVRIIANKEARLFIKKLRRV